MKQGEKLDDTQEVGGEHHIGNVGDFDREPVGFRVEMVKFTPKSKSISKVTGRLEL